MSHKFIGLVFFVSRIKTTDIFEGKVSILFQKKQGRIVHRSGELLYMIIPEIEISMC